MWGWVPFQSVGLGPLAIDWREDLLQILGSSEQPSTFYGGYHVWFCPTVDPNLRGWVPFYPAAWHPLSISGAGSPFKQRGWVPFYSMGPVPLSIREVGSPFIQWGWDPFYSV